MAKTREVMECLKCGNKQPMPGKKAKSVACISCGYEHAIVDDGEGNKALVGFYVQKNVEEQGAPDKSTLKVNI